MTGLLDARFDVVFEPNRAVGVVVAGQRDALQRVSHDAGGAIAPFFAVDGLAVGTPQTRSVGGAFAHGFQTRSMKWVVWTGLIYQKTGLAE